MKKVLLKVFLLTSIFFWAFRPLVSKAQCSCSGGTPANTIEYVVELSATNQSNTTISFPKFDPAIGTLNCVRLDDTLSIVSATGIRNYDPMEVEYEFQLTLNTKVEGPSLTRTNFKNTQYGPDLLAAYGMPGDSINYGPDTIYNNWPSTRTNSSNMTPYLGATGNVDFVYTIGGGVIAVGGANYNAQVRTTTWGTFKLTYMWCPNSVLATGVSNLTVNRLGEEIELQWKGPDYSSNDNFKIETSTDGKFFTNLKQGTGTNIIEGSSTKYKFKYRPDQHPDKKIYYRVRFERQNEVMYSETRWLMPEVIPGNVISIYPNPASHTARIKLNESVSGEVELELTNQVGQTVLKRKVWAHETSSFQLPIDNPPPPGMYMLKARVAGASKVYSGKLLFTR